MQNDMTNPRPFTQFFSDLEATPYTDNEACKILNIGTVELSRGEKLGLIKRSVLVYFRDGFSFSFIGLFDMLEYLLRKEFSFLTYGSSSEVNELVCSLVDEIASIIDLQETDRTSFGNFEDVEKNLMCVCEDMQEIWETCWSNDKGNYSATKCVQTTLMSWVSIFDRASHTRKIGHSHQFLQYRLLPYEQERTNTTRSII